MPADYKVIRDSVVVLRKGDDSAEISFEAPGIKTRFRPVLLYRVFPKTGAVRLGVSINGQNVREVSFAEGTNRTFHEVVEADVVNPSDNTLTLIARDVDDDDEINVQDMVLLYQS